MMRFSFPYFFMGLRNHPLNHENHEPQDSDDVNPHHRGGLCGGGGGWWVHLDTIPTYLVGWWVQRGPTLGGGGRAV